MRQTLGIAQHVFGAHGLNGAPAVHHLQQDADKVFVPVNLADFALLQFLEERLVKVRHREVGQGVVDSAIRPSGDGIDQVVVEPQGRITNSDVLKSEGNECVLAMPSIHLMAGVNPEAMIISISSKVSGGSSLS